jgi:cation:H+ antiporter
MGELLPLFAVFAGLSAIVVVSATMLARCADRIGESPWVGRSLAGLVLLAGATSLPELTVSWTSVRIEAGDLAVGGLIGSSLVNLLILAIVDLSTSSKGGAFSRTAAVHAFAAACSILVTGVVLVSLFVTQDVTWTYLRMGPGSIAIVLVYMGLLRLIYLDQRENQPIATATEATPPAMSMAWAVIGFTAAAAVIFFAGPHLARNSEQIAAKTGMGQTFFGTVFVAAVTSLPEAVATWTAVRIGAVDLAIGNILGSNTFNMLVLAVCDLATPQSLMSLASPAHQLTAAAAMTVTSVVSMGLLYRPNRKWRVIEPDAWLVILLVIGSFALIYGRDR